MSKALKSMDKEERARAITRRLKNNTGGLGYWAAVDANKKQVNVAADGAE